MRALFAAGLGFSVAFLLGVISPTAPARQASAPTDLSIAQVYISDPYASGASAGVPNVTPRPAACTASQALGIYDDGGSVALSCVNTLPSGVTTSGTNLAFIAQTSNPNPPSPEQLTLFAYETAPANPILPMGIDSTMQSAMPVGLLNLFSHFRVTNWEVMSCSAIGYSASGSGCSDSSGVIPSTTAAAPTQVGGAVALTYATNRWNYRQRQMMMQSVTTNNVNVGFRYPAPYFARGDQAGGGGFIWTTRWWQHLGVPSNGKIFTGLVFGRTAVVSATGEPSAEPCTAYFGADSTDSNLTFCTNDNTGTATCVGIDAGAPGFPKSSSDAGYDFWIWEPPAPLDGGASAGIYWAIQQVPAGASAYGLATTDLPDSGVLATWQVLENSGASGTNTIQMAWLYSVTAYNP